MELVKKLPCAKYVFFDDGRKQLDSFYNYYKVKGYKCELINQFKEVELRYEAGEYGEPGFVKKKLSPIQQFYLYVTRRIHRFIC